MHWRRRDSTAARGSVFLSAAVIPQWFVIRRENSNTVAVAVAVAVACPAALSTATTWSGSLYPIVTCFGSAASPFHRPNRTLPLSALSSWFVYLPPPPPPNPQSSSGVNRGSVRALTNRLRAVERVSAAVEAEAQVLRRNNNTHRDSEFDALLAERNRLADELIAAQAHR